MKPISKGARNSQLAAKARQLNRDGVSPSESEKEAFSVAWRERIAYARRLAEDPGDLIYEEMFKLFSLLNDIRALASVVSSIDESLSGALREAVQGRIDRQKRMAKLVAEDLTKKEAIRDWPFSVLVRR